MTRQELVDGLISWTPPEKWDAETFKRRDALQFALWWYGASTEADDPRPSWPGADYVESKTGGGPRYLESVDAALSLIPRNVWLNIKTGTQKKGISWQWPIVEYGDQETGVQNGAQQAKTLAVTLCIVAIKARVFASFSAIA